MEYTNTALYFYQRSGGSKMRSWSVTAKPCWQPGLSIGPADCQVPRRLSTGTAAVVRVMA